MIKSVNVKFDKLLGETPNAYLLKISGKEHWFPAKCCRKFTLNKKLGGHMIIPTWLYKEKFGIEPTEEEAETIIIQHKPVKIEPVKQNQHAELTR